MADAVEPVPAFPPDLHSASPLPHTREKDRGYCATDHPEPIVISQRCEWCSQRFALAEAQNGRCPHCNALIPGSAAARQAQAYAGLAPELADQGLLDPSSTPQSQLQSSLDLETTLPPFYFSDPDKVTLARPAEKTTISATPDLGPNTTEVISPPADIWAVAPEQVRHIVICPLRSPDWRAQVSLGMGIIICIGAVALSFLIQGFGIDQLVVNLRILAAIVAVLTVMIPFIAKTRKDSTLRVEPEGLWLQRPWRRERYIGWESLVAVHDIATTSTVIPAHSLRYRWQVLFGLVPLDSHEPGAELLFSAGRPRRLRFLDADSSDHGETLRAMISLYGPTHNSPGPESAETVHTETAVSIASKASSNSNEHDFSEDVCNANA